MRLMIIFCGVLLWIAVACSLTPPAPTAARPKKLFMDVHHLGPGKVTAKDLAEAHKKDLAAQGRHDVEYVSYYFEEATGTVRCLSSAPNAEEALAVHREAHGLMPDSIAEVIEGR